MVVARKHDEGIGQELLRHHVLHLRRVGEEIEVVLVVRESFDQPLPVVGLHGGLDARVESDEGAQQPRREAHARRAHGQLQPPGIQRPHGGKRCLEGREGAEDLLAAFVDSPAGLGEVQAPAHLLEQRNSDRRAELLDLHRGRGLRHMQLLRGSREAAQPRGRLEKVKLRQRPVPEIAADVRLWHGDSSFSCRAMPLCPQMHSGLHLIDEGRRQDAPSPIGQRSRLHLVNAGTTGAEARFDGRAAAAEPAAEATPLWRGPRPNRRDAIAL